MFNKIVLAACALALSTGPVIADHHEGPAGPPPAALMIPLPPDAMLPPPVEGPEKLVDLPLPISTRTATATSAAKNCSMR